MKASAGDRAGGWVIGLIGTQVARAPGRTAVIDRGRSMSYAGIWARVNRLARYLISTGFGPERYAMVAMAPSADQVVAVLAVLQAGGAYLPADLGQPDARIGQLLSASGAALVLTTSEDATRMRGLAAADATVIAVDATSVRSALAALPAGEVKDAERRTAMRPGHAAYLIYTSGSTGRPKGVVVEHRSLANYVTWAAQAYPGARGLALLHSSLAYDMSVTALLVPLVVGGRLQIADLRRGLPALSGPCSFLKVTPTHLAVLDVLPPLLSSGGDLVVGGEQLLGNALARWRNRHPGAAVVNEYGPTEATVGCVVHRIAPGEPVPAGVVPIGQPIDNTRAYLLDSALRPVPPEVVGELYLAGAGLARGYLGAPGLTAERFLADPFGPPGARMYRTGDLARWDAAGRLEFVGRRDDQVKIRGHRVELDEINSVLAGHESVAQAAVVVRPDGDNRRLVAYVALTADHRDATGLREHLAARLPEFMLPSAIVTVDQLPRTPNGKLDVARLPDPPAAVRPQAFTEAGPAIAPNVTAACKAMGAVLGLAELDPGADFFANGGDSITAVRLVADLRRRGFAAELADVYECRTPSALSNAIARPDAVTVGPGPVEPRAEPFALLGDDDRRWLPDDAEDAFPATRLQRGMFLHNALDGARVYRDVFSYRVQEVLDEASLRAAVRLMVRGHPALRSSFVTDGPREPIQVVHRYAEPEIRFADLRRLPAAERDRRVEDWAQAEWDRPIDLGAPGLLRVFVHQTDEQESVLSISFHNAILDGWSVATFVTGLLLAYATVHAGEPPAARRDDGALRRYVALEKAAEGSAEHRSFWRDYLDGAEPTELAALGPARCDTRLVDATLTLSEEVVARFRGAARAAGVPLRTAYLTAHLSLLAFVSGVPEVVTGLFLHGRIEDDGGDEALGLFVNTAPIRAVVNDQTWTDLMTEVFDNESAVVRHRRFPYDRIQAESTATTLCPSAFNYTDFRVFDALGAQGITVTGARYREQTNFELVVSVDEEPFTGRTVLTVTGNAEKVTAAQVRLYARLFERLVWQAATVAHERVVRSLAQWAAAQGETSVVPDGQPAPHPSSVLALVVERIRAAPQAVVQVHAGVAMTWRELAVRASGVAREVAARGGGPGTRVACFLERGLDPLVAMLGTWVAGASYVPIDPALALARQREQVTQVGCTVAVRSSGVDREQIAWAGPEVRLTTDAAGTESASNVDSWTGPGAEAEAYVMFTSGSTGAPKAVSMPHRALANLIDWQARQPEYAGARRAAQFAAVSFDVSLLDSLSAAASGAVLHVVPDEGRRDPQALLTFLTTAAIEVAILPTVAFHQLVAAWEVCGPTPVALRHLVVSGEALVVTDAVRRFFKECGAQLINMYGPTETHGMTYHYLGSDPQAWPDRPPIGDPIQNVRLRILDPSRRPVPRSTPGELYIGGSAVGLGYVTANGLDPRTAEHFVDLDGATTHRFYRTGDIVRWDGSRLEFLGRRDDQVKISGFRVEPSEVAAVLLRHPGVRECAVRPVSMANRGPVLVAYVVPEGEAPPVEALTAHARAALPGYAVPSYVEILDRLPATRHGKVDARLLPPPRPPQPAAPAPATPTERRVLAVWEQVLGHPVPAPTISFTDAGGSSLLLLPLYQKLRREFARDIPIRDLLGLPTAQDIAAVLAGPTEDVSGPAAGAAEVSGDAGDAVSRLDPEDPWLPLTPAQEGMWLDQQLLESPWVRHLLVTLSLHGPLDARRLAAAWSTVVGAHPALRTAFRLDGRRLRQRLPVGDPGADALPTRPVTAAGLPEAVEALRRAPLALDEGRNYTATLLRIDVTYHVFVLVVHHIVGDVDTLQLLLDDLAAAYGPPAGPQRPPDRYRDAVLAGQRLRTPTPEVAGFWRSRLPADPFTLPMPAHPSTSLRTLWTLAPVAGETWRRVGRAARIHSVNPPLIVLAALVRALGELTDRDRLVIGLPVSTRDRPEWRGTAGLFLETLVLVLDRPPPAATFADTLAHVAQRFAESLTHLVAFQYLAAAARPDRSARDVPLVEILFNYLSRPLAPPVLTGLDAVVRPPVYTDARFPMAIYCEESEHDLLMRFGRHAERISAGWINRLVAAVTENLDRGLGEGRDGAG